MRPFLSLIAVVLASGLPVGEARAAGDAPCTRPLRLAYSMLPPLYYLDETGKRGQGIEPELADELSRRTGCRFEASYESRVRIWAAFEAGQVDISLSGVSTPERERFGVFLPYVRFRNVLLMREGDAAAAKAPANPMNDPAAAVVVTRGFRYGPRWDAWIKQQEERGLVSYVAEEGDAVRLVAIGRASTTIVRDIAWPFYDKQYRDEQRLRRVDVGAADGALSIVLSRKTLGADAQAAFARALAEMRADGSLRQILRRHVGAEQVDRISLE